MLSICMSNLLKAAFVKEETDEVQKEVEIALLALSEMGYGSVEQKVHLKEITEIIQHHQKHHNLKRNEYLSAWQFLISRFLNDRRLERMIVDELHFVREATRELEGLSKSVNWNRKEKEANETIALERWLHALNSFAIYGQIQDEKYSKLTTLIIDMYMASKFNYRNVHVCCLFLFVNVILRKAESPDCFLCEKAVDFILEEMLGPTINNEATTLSAFAIVELLIERSETGFAPK
ncbi:uncharacterized protein MONOS_7365 [Monocercomonoides exilis]|uniref:uncharacterized protein n=1 Tax=Monocercomonoides exilis TaxID=2049356 RepID=UPI003559543F|nr:hypothetical protein MONOS_7365 [Monocercomonoides exilis]|eukprot:MONOS_7365.1-p1 / transcript=MONOS_7365.1 / gene=MONOS_7365 / organism=Monocercomonoides_exilis_PA203 / gene_product=unspecified product / transcript_product=unspecified product / location=Mono_scaffold00249:69211-69977(-) / protein_length=235 / sequence_SO=supercontig / SO=protein_coding / is_pseudo=false